MVTTVHNVGEKITSNNKEISETSNINLKREQWMGGLKRGSGERTRQSRQVKRYGFQRAPCGFQTVIVMDQASSTE